MITPENVQYELRGRLEPLRDLGKVHLSVRYEPGPRVVRVGACIEHYTWDTRAEVIDKLLEYEDAHADEFALEFDVVPLEAVNDAAYAHA